MIKKILLNCLIAVALAAFLGIAGYALTEVGTYIETYIELNDNVGNNAIVHDARMLLRAEKSIEQFRFFKAVYYQGALFTVTARDNHTVFEITDSDKTYTVVNRLTAGSVNGYQNEQPDDSLKMQMSQWNDISENRGHQRVLEESKKLLFAYIASSEIFKDKAYLQAELDKVTVKTGLINTAGLSIFSGEDRVICINTDDVRKDVIIHELVHALQDITRGGLDAQNPMFTEIMTDIITNAVYPNNNIRQISMYRDYNPSVLNALGIFKQKAIEAFFCGYEVLYNVITADEWYLYMYIIEAMVRAPRAPYIAECYNNLITKWLVHLPAESESGSLSPS